MVTVSRENNEIDDCQILGKALCNAAESLGFSKTEAAGIIGRERTNIVRDGIDPNSKSGELALMFIRVYRGLFAVVGGDQEDMRHWVTTDNQYFGRSPKQMMTTHHQGLAQVLMYLDAIRGEGLAEPLPQELTPLERLKGSVKRYERPTDPIWDDYFDSDEGVSDDFMAERHQPPKGR